MSNKAGRHQRSVSWRVSVYREDESWWWREGLEGAGAGQDSRDPGETLPRGEAEALEREWTGEAVRRQGGPMVAGQGGGLS